MTGFFTAPGNEGNAYRREVIANLAGDAMRQMNPWRDSSPAKTPATAATTPTATSLSSNENARPGSLASTDMSPAARRLAAGMPSTNPLSSLDTKPKVNTPGQIARDNLTGAAQKLAAPPQQPFRTTTPGGMTSVADNQGNRTYTMGTPGQDGYGRVSVRPGSETGQTARNALVANVPQAGQQTRQAGGLTVTGSTDAVSRLAAPVGTYDRNSPEYIQAQAQNYQKANPFSQNNPYDDRLSYRPPQGSDSPLIAPPPVAMGGGGWKSRAEADRANAAAYGDYARSLSSLQGAAVQERGANYRAGLQQQGVNDRNAIDREGNVIARQRLMGDLAYNDARIASEGVNTQKGQMEIESLRAIKAASDEYLKSPTPENERKYRALVGKFEKEPQYGTVGRYDDQGMRIGEDLYNKQTGELVRRDDSDRLHPIPKDPKDLVTGRIYITKAGVGR